MSILKAVRIEFSFFNLWIFKNSLVFQIAPVCGLGMLHFPAQVFYLCFQLCLLIFKQFLPGTGLYVVGVRICVLKRVSALSQEFGSIEEVLPVDPGSLSGIHLLRDSVFDSFESHSL